MHVDHSYIIDTQSHSHSKYSNITTPIKEKTTTTINPIKATSMTIDKTNKSHSMTIDEPMILSDNDTISEDNDSQKNTSYFTTNLNWDEEVTQTHSPNTNLSIKKTNDIRNTTPVDEQAKILEYCNEIDQCERNPEAITNLFIKFRETPKGFPRTSLEGIFSKIKHRDRDFFRTFARNDLIKD
jgi:hypothetical protein